MKLLNYDELIWALKRINLPLNLLLKDEKYEVSIRNNELFFNDTLVQRHTIDTVIDIFINADYNQYKDYWYIKLMKTVFEELNETDKLYLFL